MAVNEVQLTALDLREGLRKCAAAMAQRFDLAAHKNDACLEGILDGIIAPRLSVLRDTAV